MLAESSPAVSRNGSPARRRLASTSKSPLPRPTSANTGRSPASRRSATRCSRPITLIGPVSSSGRSRAHWARIRSTASCSSESVSAMGLILPSLETKMSSMEDNHWSTPLRHRGGPDRLGLDVHRHRAVPPARPPAVRGHGPRPARRPRAAGLPPPAPPRRLVVEGDRARAVQHRDVLPAHLPGRLPPPRRPGRHPPGQLAPRRDGHRLAGDRRAGRRGPRRRRPRRAGRRDAARAAQPRPRGHARARRSLRVGAGQRARVRADQALEGAGRPAHAGLLAARRRWARPAAGRPDRRRRTARDRRPGRARVPVDRRGRHRAGLRVLVPRAPVDVGGLGVDHRAGQPGRRDPARRRVRARGVRAGPGARHGAGARRGAGRAAVRPEVQPAGRRTSGAGGGTHPFSSVRPPERE